MEEYVKQKKKYDAWSISTSIPSYISFSKSLSSSPASIFFFCVILIVKPVFLLLLCFFTYTFSCISPACTHYLTFLCSTASIASDSISYSVPSCSLPTLQSLLIVHFISFRSLDDKSRLLKGRNFKWGPWSMKNSAMEGCCSLPFHDFRSCEKVFMVFIEWQYTSK